jgi:hypothetical protein
VFFVSFGVVDVADRTMIAGSTITTPPAIILLSSYSFTTTGYFPLARTGFFDEVGEL